MHLKNRDARAKNCGENYYSEERTEEKINLAFLTG
jgi:hypothetical protein